MFRGSDSIVIAHASSAWFGVTRCKAIHLMAWAASPRTRSRLPRLPASAISVKTLNARFSEMWLPKGKRERRSSNFSGSKGPTPSFSRALASKSS